MTYLHCWIRLCFCCVSYTSINALRSNCNMQTLSGCFCLFEAHRR